jgi:hypothetical protein
MNNENNGRALIHTNNSNISDVAHNGLNETSVVEPTKKRQWYLENPDLQSAEIQAMIEFKPDAQYGYLPNGKMYWLIKLHPIVYGIRKNWTLLMVYHDNHPQKKYWGETINIYPISPNPNEILDRMGKAGITTKTIPHTIKDSCGHVYINVGTGSTIRHQSHFITSADSLLRQAIRWINIFELGLIDPVTWEGFQGDAICGDDHSLILQENNEAITPLNVIFSANNAQEIPL